ncbi:MAG: hypothetical protein ACREEU_10390 [Acetobacteraceae bacterium]
MRTVGPISIVAEAGGVRVLLDDETTDDCATGLLTPREARDFMVQFQRVIHEAEQQCADQACQPGPIAAGAELR